MRVVLHMNSEAVGSFDLGSFATLVKLCSRSHGAAMEKLRNLTGLYSR